MAAILIRFPLLLALLLLGALSPASAAVEEVDLVVEGMECSLCARGVENSLGGLPGVESARADLGTGEVKVLAATGHSLDLEKIQGRIARWGFRVAPEPLLIRAVGTLNHGLRDRLTFQVLGTNESFDLLEGDELKRLLQSLPASGSPRISLTARVHRHPRSLPASLSILSYEVKKP